MKLKRLPKIQYFFLLLLVLAAVYFLFLRAPSEAAMIEKFHQHKVEFEQLRLMLRQDKNVETIGSDWVTAKWDEKGELPLNVSVSRIALYRSRLKALGFSRIDSHEGRVQMEEFGGGFADTTWGIGYVWSSVTLKPLVESAYNEMPMRDTRCFSPLEENWYIYHRR